MKNQNKRSIIQKAANCKSQLTISMILFREKHLANSFHHLILKCKTRYYHLKKSYNKMATQIQKISKVSQQFYHGTSVRLD